MKDKTIVAMVDKGVPADRAVQYWAVLVKSVCGGTEPSAEDIAVLTDSDILSAFEGDKLAGRRLLRALRGGQPEAPKKWKASKASTYTSADLVTFLAAESSLSADDRDSLRDEILRRTRGSPFRFLVDGTLRAPETTERLRALADRDPVAPFVVIDGREVVPVGFDAEEEKTHAEDPFQRGVALGQPGNVSGRLGVSLDGVDRDTQRAIAVAMDHDLRDAPNAILLTVAETAKGKTPEQVLAAYPKARRTWQNMPPERRPTLLLTDSQIKATRGGSPPPPFVADGDPIQIRAGSAPVVYVVGAELERAAAAKFREHAAVAIRSGEMRLVFDADCPPGGLVKTWQVARLAEATAVMILVSASTLAATDTSALRGMAARLIPVIVSPCGWKSDPAIGSQLALPRNDRPARLDDGQWASVVADLRRALAAPRSGTEPMCVTVATPPSLVEIAEAIVTAGLAQSRDALLSGIDRRVIAGIPANTRLDAQVMTDVHRLSERLVDGSIPLATYLENARRFAGPRRESAIFRRAIESIFTREGHD